MLGALACALASSGLVFDSSLGPNFRFDFTGVRGPLNNLGGISLTEIRLYDAQGVLLPPEAIHKVENEGGGHFPQEVPASLVDGRLDTKWLDLEFITGETTASSLSITLVAGAPEPKSYDFVTAMVQIKRDPTVWSFSRLTPCNDWYPLASVEVLSPPLARRVPYATVTGGRFAIPELPLTDEELIACTP
eukprot:scaffold3601_cov101-Isochrysis_galbana.AAC.1